jgi:uncharacterized protein YqeY
MTAATPSEVRTRMQQDLQAAMKARDTVTLDTLRMAMTSLTLEETGKGAGALDDDAVLAVLSRELKRRREAADTFVQAGRPELADIERQQEEVLLRYLPEPMSPEELAAVIEEAISQAQEQGLSGPKAMGPVMKLVQPQVKGRADGKVVSSHVKSRLLEG